MTNASPVEGDTLVEAALKVLLCGNPQTKAAYSAETVRLWQNGLIKEPFPGKQGNDAGNAVGRIIEAPDRPGRDSSVVIVSSSSMGSRGRGGSLASRKAMLHSLVHIESWAIDLSWDIIVRFGQKWDMPRAFFDDFVKVADDEGRHFLMLEKRLQEIGSYYGELPAHDGLWQSAMETAGDLKARLVIEHCVHEARGLDILPQTIARFRTAGDDATASLLELVIYPEEITHVEAGLKWFKYLCGRDEAAGRGLNEEHPAVHRWGRHTDDAAPGEVTSSTDTGTTGPHSGCREADGQTGHHGQDAPGVGAGQAGASSPAASGQFPFAVEAFHAIVRSHFKGKLKPPFNTDARAKAGFSEEWYLPLAS